MVEYALILAACILVFGAILYVMTATIRQQFYDTVHCYSSATACLAPTPLPTASPTDHGHGHGNG